MSAPNQEIIRGVVRPAFDKEHIFARIHINALQEAMVTLKGETLKLWLYIAKNRDNHDFELSQKALEEWGLKKDAYYAAKKKLKELGYLVPIKKGSNIFDFYESLSEKPKEQSSSEKPKDFSEKPKDFSEKPKDFSEKPQRNTTNTTNTTIIQQDNSYPEVEEGTLDNPIVVNKEWLVMRANETTALNNGLFKYGKYYYKMEE